MTIRVITVSDRAFAGEYEDRTGPAVVDALIPVFPEAEISLLVVPDEPAELQRQLDNAVSIGTDGNNPVADIILAAGGTGLGPRDNTPDVLESWGDRIVPGIGELLRGRSLEQTAMASLSRLTAVQKDRCLVIGIPGSVRGAVFCVEVLAPILEHAVKMMHGKGH